MTAVARLLLVCAGQEERRALSSVLAPDNVGGPRGLSITTESRRGAVEFQIRSNTLSTAISTALGILRDVSLFEEVWLLSHGQDARARRA